MDRRKLLRGLGAGAASLSLTSTAWPKPFMAPSESRRFETSHRNRTTKIIGVGGAGCNFIRSLKSSLDTRRLTNIAELVCIDLGTHCLAPVDTLKQTTVGGLPLKTISLAPYGAGGRVNAARAAALRHIDVLKAVVNGAGTVILVAGLGGGTGIGVTRIIARLARNAGAITIAAVVMPFDFEGLRNGTADTALSNLGREVDLVMPFSNQELGDSLGDSALLSDLHAQQDQRVTQWLQRLNLG